LESFSQIRFDLLSLILVAPEGLSGGAKSTEAGFYVDFTTGYVYEIAP
jgi:hypothetical protein